MNEETSHAIVGDAVAAASEEATPKKRRWFRRRRPERKLSHCENCGAALTGKYCGECGQAAVDYRRSFGRVMMDALDSFLNWDSKFFATCALLLTRPWRLTNAFIGGQRARYVHPLRLYLLISIAFFFGVHELAKHAKFDQPKRANLTAEQRAEIEEAVKAVPPEFREKVRKAIAPPTPTATPAVGVSVSAGSPAEERPGFEFKTDAGSGEGKSGFDRWINRRMKEKVGDEGVNAKTFFLAVVSNLAPMMLCCIPLFALVLKVLYVRRPFYYIDHLIYGLHAHSFAYVAILLIGFVDAGLRPPLSGLVRAFLIITAVALLWLAARQVYRQGWFMTTVKFLVGGFIYFIVLCAAFVATFFITLAL